MWTELFLGRIRYMLPYLTGSIAEPDSPKGSKNDFRSGSCRQLLGDFGPHEPPESGRWSAHFP